MTESSQVPPSAVLFQLAGAGLRISQALYVAAKLGIADHLAERALTSSELASLVEADVDAIRRLMRTLVVLGVFAESEDDRFALAPVGQLLQSNTPTSLRSTVLFVAGDLRWRCWGDLLGSVRTGKPVAERVLGMAVFDYYAANPAHAVTQVEAMAQMTGMVAERIVESYDFSRFRSIVDVGGGSGRFLAEILRRHRGVRGIVFDLPHAVGEAQPVLEAAGVAGRCKTEGGSFFEKVPKGGDGYLLKQIIHDWDDGRAKTILSACRQAMTPEATLLIVDRVLPERAEPGKGIEHYLIDLEMLLMAGGRERTETEFGRLLGEARFGLQRVISTGAPLSIIEAVPT